jgi:hypothetical protein
VGCVLVPVVVVLDVSVVDVGCCGGCVSWVLTVGELAELVQVLRGPSVRDSAEPLETKGPPRPTAVKPPPASAEISARVSLRRALGAGDAPPGCSLWALPIILAGSTGRDSRDGPAAESYRQLTPHQ